MKAVALVAEAETLFELGIEDEARRRTIASRAYYAAYHAVLETPHGERFDKKNGIGTHKQLFDHLKNTSDRTVLQARSLLLRLYQLRLVADYELQTRLRVEMTKARIEDFRKLTALIAGSEESEEAEPA